MLGEKDDFKNQKKRWGKKPIAFFSPWMGLHGL